MDVIIEYGINWIWYKCEDYRVLQEYAHEHVGKDIPEWFITKLHDGYYGYRVHK